jgi:hypothetical protein
MSCLANSAEAPPTKTCFTTDFQNSIGSGQISATALAQSGKNNRGPAMRYIISFLFFSPFWLQLAIAGALVFVGVNERQGSAAEREQAIAQLQAAPPATVAIADFAATKPDDGPREFSVSAQFAAEHNTRLITTKKGKTVDEKLMIVLIDPEAAADEKVARAVIVFEPEQQDAMVDWLVANMTTMGEAGPVVTIAGLVTRSSEASNVADALRDQGMTKAPDFFFMQPFVNGRDAGYKARIASIESRDGTLFFSFAGIFALIGFGKLLLRRVRDNRRSTTGGSDPTGESGLRGASSFGGAGLSQSALSGSRPMAQTANLYSARSPGGSQPDPLAQWASSPSEDRTRSAARAEYLTPPKDASFTSLSRIAKKERKSSKVGFSGFVAILVVLGYFMVQLGGTPANLSDVFAQFGQFADVTEAANPDNTAQNAAPEPAPAAEGTPPTARPGKEPWMSNLVLFTLIALVLFVVVQRRKANRF